MPLPTPDSNADVGKLPAIYSNANFIHEVDLANNTLWAAGEGGIVALESRSGGQRQIHGSPGVGAEPFRHRRYMSPAWAGRRFWRQPGLQIFDARNGIWNTLTSANSAMSYDDVATVRCYPDQGFLVVGYRQHGLDIFDAGTNVWDTSTKQMASTSILLSRSRLSVIEKKSGSPLDSD